MPTITSGVFFMAQRQASPMASGEGDEFTLTLHMRDNQGAHCIEPYVLTWRGAAAAEWWRANAPLAAGTPLLVVASNPRSFTGLRGSPYTAAQIQECRRAPLAPSWSKPAAPAAS